MGNAEVVFLGRLEIDHDTYLASANEALGRSISRKIDGQGLSITETFGYLTTLAEMKDGASDIDGSILNHSFYSFMLVCPMETLFDLREHTNLSVHSEPCKRGLHFSVVSGNLSTWREAIINCCADHATFEVRLVMDKCLLLFEKEGLGKLWAKYVKRPSGDGTFKLIESR